MKRYLIPTITILLVLAVAWTAFGQAEEQPRQRGNMRERFQNMSEEERAKMRERFANMSEEERARMRQRGGFGRGGFINPEDQEEAIKTIEEQLTKLKAAQITRPEGGFQNLSQEERTRLRENMQERQKALQTIIAQVARLQGRRQPTAEGGQFLLINTEDLKPILEAAKKEKAKEINQLLERLIASGSGRGFGGRPGSGQRPQGGQRGTRGQRPVGPMITVRTQNMSEEEREKYLAEGGGMRERFQNMSEPERDRFRAEMQERRERYINMSEAEREKFRAEIRERMMGGGRPPVSRRISLSREQQLKAISVIEQQVAKLKAVVLSIGTDDQRQFRDLTEEQRTKLREKRATAARERFTAIRAIEQELAKLRGPARPQQLQPGPERLDRPPRQRPARDTQSAGKRAPQFELNSFDGKTVNLSDYRGKTVVLEWFNMECPFSLYHYETKNTMAGLAEKYKSKNVVWFAVNSTNHTTPEANKTFAEKYKLAFPILDDRSGKVGRAYGAKTTPHIFIINPRGRIVYDGAIDNAPMGKTKEGVVNYVDNVLAELTAGKDISIKNSKPYGCTVKYANK